MYSFILTRKSYGLFINNIDVFELILLWNTFTIIYWYNYSIFVYLMIFLRIFFQLNFYNSLMLEKIQNKQKINQRSMNLHIVMMIKCILKWWLITKESIFSIFIFKQRKANEKRKKSFKVFYCSLIENYI